MAKQSEKEFNWQAGSQLTHDDYEPVQEIRKIGFSRLADGILANPNLRKEERKKKLNRPLKIKKEGLILEESHSGLHEEFTPSEAARLIHKGSKGIKGIVRFGKPTPPKDKSKK